MRVKVIKKYYDKITEKINNIEEVLEVDEKRAEVLVNAGVCEIIIKETNPEETNPEKDIKSTQKLIDKNVNNKK